MSITKMSREELITQIRDPDTDLSASLAYLRIEYDDQQGVRVYAPTKNLKIEDAVDSPLTEASVTFDWVVQALRDRRENLFERDLVKHADRGIILLDGDSWAQHPFVVEIYEHLRSEYIVTCNSLAGRWMQELHDEELYIEKLDDLADRDLLHRVQAIVLSGGGNDLFGNVMSYLKNFDENRPTDPLAHIDLVKFDGLISHIGELYDKVIKKIEKAHPNLDIPIIVHSYAYITPWDVTFSIPPKDKWIGDPMRSKGIVDQSLQKDIVGIMVNKFHQMLEERQGRNLRIIDNRDKLHNKGLWSDEIHPSDNGFKVVVESIKALLPQA